MQKSAFATKMFAVIILIVSVILSLFVLYTPSPSSSPQHFSSERALTYIKEISEAPHSVFDADAHEDVRLYIKDTLTTMLGAANVREYNYPISTFATKTGEIRNLLGIIPGKSDTAIMIVGHYDSVPESYGAADDGYALGTMLEIADLYKDQQLENTIYFLFTDAEEMGMDGAAAVVEEKDLMSKVGFVINVEARGVSGPAIMFETSPNNKKVIDFYRQANLPVSYSLATAIYQVMPNDTDFTLFRENGMNGVNFAVVEGIEHYHTSLDNYNELNASSIQHYGEQIVPLVDAFTRDAKYSDINFFDADEGSIFFTLLPNVFVSYTGTAANVLHFVTLALLIAVTFLLLRGHHMDFRKAIRKLLLFVGIFLGAVLLSVGFAVLTAVIGGVMYFPTYVVVNGSEWTTLLFLLAITAGVLAIYTRLSNSLEKQRTFLFFGIAFQLSLAILTGFLMPGVSFLFFFPALLGIVSLAASIQKNKIMKYLAYATTSLICLLLIVPILKVFFLSLTVGCAPVLVAVLLIHLTVLIPVVRLLWNAGNDAPATANTPVADASARNTDAM